MDWLKSLSRRVCLALDVAADNVQTLVDILGDAIADLPETIGNGFQDVCNTLGDMLATVPITGSFLQTVLRWAGGTIAGLTNLVGVVVKAAAGIISGGIGALIRLPAGILFLNTAQVRKGLLDIFSPPAGAVIIVLGVFWSLIQRIFFFQNFERSLTREERTALRNIFHDSLALYNIRLIEGHCGLFGVNTRAFTLGNTIYLKRNEAHQQRATLVHECVHVWQYQHFGPRYTMEALGAQWLLPNAYNWEAEAAHGRSQWQDFNREAQAKLLDDIWTFGSLARNGNTIRGDGCFYDADRDLSPVENEAVTFRYFGKDYTILALEAVRALRSRRNLRVSKLL